MTLPLSAADVLAEHVVLDLDCIDRVYANAYVPRLTYPGGSHPSSPTTCQPPLPVGTTG